MRNQRRYSFIRSSESPPPSVILGDYSSMINEAASCQPLDRSLLSGRDRYYSEPSAEFMWEGRIEIRGRMLVIQGRGETPKWLESTLQGIEDAARLEEDWDSYGAKRVEPSSIVHSISLLFAILPDDSIEPHVSPVNNGGIQFSWHTPEVNLEIEVSPNGDIAAYRENIQTGDEWEVEMAVDLRQLQDEVSVLRNTSAQPSD